MFFKIFEKIEIEVLYILYKKKQHFSKNLHFNNIPNVHHIETIEHFLSSEEDKQFHTQILNYCLTHGLKNGKFPRKFDVAKGICSKTPCQLWLDSCTLHQRTTCWTLLQWSRTVSSTPCHGALTPAPLSTYPSIECKRTAPHIETPICTHRTSHHFIWQQLTCSALDGSPVDCEVGEQPHQNLHFHH